MFPRVRDTDPCPCGSGGTYDGCCAPAHRGEPATTPEALMRSRYAAFVVGDAAYLRETWHPGTRPETIDPDAAVRWRGLEIVDVERGGPGDRRGVVEFRARWREAGRDGELHERSRFVRQSDRWWYLDGEVR
ncbi:YchJ family protein [Microbacterium sp. CJ88]|uniref:YchJ family protein n=1 Tax=Microbacterium sp. CJ88 TaxID=3445672 RepID=UPI003F6600F5